MARILLPPSLVPCSSPTLPIPYQFAKAFIPPTPYTIHPSLYYITISISTSAQCHCNIKAYSK